MDVMISYSRADAAFVSKLDQFLGERGIELWIDREGIKPFTKWRRALMEKLRTCDACIVLLSPAYLASEHCRMEVFVARSFGRLILPIMLADCFGDLRSHEETKGLEALCMMKMHEPSAFGLPLSEQDALVRVADAILREPRDLGAPGPVYVSYSNQDGPFATRVARELSVRGVPVWVATKDIRVGESCRDAQARAMLHSSAHLVILGEGLTDRAVLRTEILLAEAQGLDVFTILPERLAEREESVRKLMQQLNDAQQTYRRLAEVQALAWSEDGIHIELLAEQLKGIRESAP